MTTYQPVDPGGLDQPAEVNEVITAAIGHAFQGESKTRQRQPHHLGISSLGSCTRRCAFAIAEVEPSDAPEAGEGRAANLGTWQHTGLLPQLAANIENATIEQPVTLRAGGLEFPGHLDLHAPGIVLDLKTVGEWRLQTVRREGIFPDHLMQVAAYALAKIQEGQPIQWLTIIYLDRASGDQEVITVEFTNHHLTMVIDRATELREWAQDPDTAPKRDAGGRPMLGPGYSYKCDECPWLRRCWGDDVQPGKRVRHEHDNDEVEALLLEYIEQNAIEGPAKRRKAEIVELLGGVRQGTYGRARYNRSPDTIVDDPYASARALRALGYPVPQRPKQGTLSIRLIKTTKPSRKATKK